MCVLHVSESKPLTSGALEKSNQRGPGIPSLKTPGARMLSFGGSITWEKGNTYGTGIGMFPRFHYPVSVLTRYEKPVLACFIAGVVNTHVDADLAHSL